MALVQNYLVSNQNTGSYRIVPKINFVFYRKGSSEPVSLNHYGRSRDVTRFMWGVFLGYFFILRIECLCRPQSPPYLLGLGFHAHDQRMIYFVFVFRMLLPFYFIFFVHVSES